MIRTFIMRILIFLATLSVALELFFRLVLPAAEMPAGRQDPRWLIMSMDRDAQEAGRHSIGRLCRPVFQWHVNNFGFNSSYDYVEGDVQSHPCAVVIGNSYVEGLYSNVDEHLAALLNQHFSPGTEFYNLAASGMPLSQVPLVAAFAAETFNPRLFVIQVGASSLSRSIRNNGRVPYCRQYSLRGGKLTATAPSKFRAKRLNRLLRHSAIVRYLFYNAHVNLGNAGDVVESVAATAEPGTIKGIPLEVYDRVLDEIFDQIRAVTSAPILVVCDSDRNAMYASGLSPKRLEESVVVEAACRRHQALFLDLTEPFWQEYSRNGKKFNFDDNYHWNPYGVKIVAKAVASMIRERNLLPPTALGAASP